MEPEEKTGDRGQLSVKGEDIQKQNTTNALQALQGQAAGVQITSTSGQPGSGMNVIIAERELSGISARYM
jgi:hypothetical protein